jgi:hypothetical protein
VLAGVVAGRIVGRGQGHRPDAMSHGALRGVAAGGVVGLMLGTLAWLSSGSLAPGRMSRLGPTPWQVGLAAAVEIGLVAAATAAFMAWRQSPRALLADVVAAVADAPAPVAVDEVVADEATADETPS